jgi:hypothetical protein
MIISTISVGDTVTGTALQEVIKSTCDSGITGTAVASDEWPSGGRYLYSEYYICDIDDIIKEIPDPQWKLDSPRLKYRSAKAADYIRAFDRRMYVNAYKSARSPPR